MRQLILCVVIILVQSCAHNRMHSARDDNHMVEYEVVEDTPADELLIISLYRQLEKIADDDTTINTLVHTVKATLENEDEVITFSMHIDTVRQALRIEDETTMNSSYSISEYRAIITTRGIKFLHSEFTGTPAYGANDDVEVYEYDAVARTFLRDTITEALLHVQLKDFFIPQTPDSVIAEYESHASVIAHLVYNERGVVQWMIWDRLMAAKSGENKWLAGDEITIEFSDNMFARSKPYFSEP